MSDDPEGYYFPPHKRTLARLMEDIRILGPAGVERAASGWDTHVGEHGLETFHTTERAALHAIEQADRGPAWDEVRRSLFGLTESGGALISWQAEHGAIGHKAERAAFATAMALIAQDLIKPEQFSTLAAPMSEALPWLLPEN